MPPPALDRAGLRQPPQVVAGRIPQGCERALETLPQRHVRPELRDQRIEGVEVVGTRAGSQAVIEDLLPQRALGPIEPREHSIEVEVVPGPVVERAFVAGRHARPVILGDDIHAPPQLAQRTHSRRRRLSSSPRPPRPDHTT